MGLHEINLGGVFISPLLVYALLAFPITRLVMYFIHKIPLSRWIWHEILFSCSLYAVIFSVLTLVMAIL